MNYRHILELGLPIGGPNVPGRTLYNPISAIVMGGISAVTSIIGGVKKAGAAKSAAQIQAEAAQAAGKQVTDATEKVNPDILAAAKRAGEGVTSAADTAATGVTTAATDANKLLNPYSEAGATAAGVLNSGIAAGGDFNKTPTMADLQIDPGYAFRAQQGEEALTRSAAAHGGVGGGGFQKDLAGYSQGLASQEYQAAFNRFETSQQNRFANVNAVANSGRLAAGEQGGNLIGAATYGGNVRTDASKYAGSADINATDVTSGNTINAARTSADYLTQAANAQAAGKVAASNATWDGITGAANTGLGVALATRPSTNYIQRPDISSSFGTLAKPSYNPYGPPGRFS